MRRPTLSSIRERARDLPPTAGGPTLARVQDAEAAMRRRALLGTAAAAAAAPGPRHAGAQADADAVDVLLVLAVDVSRSIDADEARLQREGYRSAITHPMVMEAVRGGMLGAIGLAYVEWSGAEQQRLVLPWTRIASRADAEAWAGALDRAPPWGRPPSPVASTSPAKSWARRRGRRRGASSTSRATG